MYAVENAKAADKIFIEYAIEQGDLDKAIHKLGLEFD